MPDFPYFIKPVPERPRDGKQRAVSKVREDIAVAPKVNAEDRKLTSPKGKHGAFDTRFSRAKTRLKQAGLLENVSRGVFIITGKGSSPTPSSPGGPRACGQTVRRQNCAVARATAAPTCQNYSPKKHADDKKT
ncbi:MAG: winged helix-turn-helix domain-containing protein [Deltaproteobacteria bacterium]|nr:winged helix-turn-helix domain-containing protein [Deltaproteobacteria bacterium]